MLCMSMTIPTPWTVDSAPTGETPMSLYCEAGINSMRCYYVKKRRKDSRY